MIPRTRFVLWLIARYFPGDGLSSMPRNSRPDLMLPLLALVVVNIRGHHQFKAHQVSALCARRELVSRLEAGPVRQAVFRVRDLIYPRLGNYLSRFVNSLAGIGIHALDRVAWGT